MTMALLFLIFSVLVSISKGFPRQEIARVVSSVGGQTTLPCVFQNKESFTPRYLVQWQRDGVIVPVYIWLENYPPHINKQYEGRVSLAGRASLNLTQVMKSDEGMYECVVFLLFNQQSMKPMVTKVYLEVQDVLPATKPPKYLMKRIGESAELDCSVDIDHSSNVSYRWLHNGHDLDAFEDLCKRAEVNENGTLTIDSLLSSDTGTYTCLVLRRDYNDSWSSTTKLIVED